MCYHARTYPISYFVTQYYTHTHFLDTSREFPGKHARTANQNTGDSFVLKSTLRLWPPLSADLHHGHLKIPKFVTYSPFLAFRLLPGLFLVSMSHFKLIHTILQKLWTCENDMLLSIRPNQFYRDYTTTIVEPLLG